MYSMTKQRKGPPLFIKIIAILYIFSISIAIVFHFIPSYSSFLATKYARWYPTYTLTTDIVNLVAFILLWKMRRWSIYILIATFVIQLLVSYFLLNNPVPNTLDGYLINLVQVVILAFIISQHKKMN